MVLRRINNWVVIVVIFCSTSIYKLSALGSLQKVAELMGGGIIAVLIILLLAYSDKTQIKKNFVLPMVLISVALILSMFMAFYSRDQSFSQTMVAQRAIYYYFLYILLHQLQIKPKDIQTMFIAFGILYIFLYLIQFFLYPTILFDAYVRLDRGTVRIYLPGSDYMFITFFLCVQWFFRTNRLKYLIFLLSIFSIFILSGGRQTMATVILVVVMFLFYDKKVKSKLMLSFLGLLGVFAGFLIFQDIFQAILLESRSDASLGKDYIRLKAAEFFLTDFFKSPFAYITGNGMYFNTSDYGKEITYNMLYRSFVLGDIGIVGNYAIYGAFFVIGVIAIIIRALRIRINANYVYIKLMFITMLVSIVIAGGFAHSETVCFVTLMIYILDVSKFEKSRNSMEILND